MKQTFNRIAFFLMICLISCRENPGQTSGKDFMYYRVFDSTGWMYNDTLSGVVGRKHDPNDTLLAREFFEYQSYSHCISMYTNTNHFAGVDGGYIFYELDSMGACYIKSLTWENYARLVTANDSLNNIIDLAVEHIIVRRALN